MGWTKQVAPGAALPVERGPIDRAKKWDRKVTPDHWEFIIRATKDIAVEKMTEYQSIFQTVYNTVKRVVAKHAVPPSDHHAYNAYGLKVAKCVFKYKGDAERKCTTAALLLFLGFGYRYEVLWEIAKELGGNPYRIGEYLERLGLVPWRFEALNRSAGPDPVTSTESRLYAVIELNRDIYIEGVQLRVTNPVGSGTDVRATVVALTDKGEFQLGSAVTVAEGETFIDYLRFIYDAIPDGANLEKLAVRAQALAQPAQGREPLVELRAFGVAFKVVV